MSTILAIETSSEFASAALLHDDKISALQAAGVQNHSQHILPMVQQLLREAGISMRMLDALAFGAGPGSFTGVRTACGIAQGLAFACQLPVLPLITLKAMAQQCFALDGAHEVLALLDARMGQVYYAQYRLSEGDWHEVQPPALCDPAQVQAIGAPLLCGNVPYPLPQLAALPVQRAVQVASASGLLPLAQRELAQGRAIPAAQAQPLYLRNKIALTTEERMAERMKQERGLAPLPAPHAPAAQI